MKLVGVTLCDFKTYYSIHDSMVSCKEFKMEKNSKYRRRPTHVQVN